MHSQITRNGIAGIDKSINPTESHSFRYFRSQRCDIYIVLRVLPSSSSLLLFFGLRLSVGTNLGPVAAPKVPAVADPTPALA